MQYFVTGATGFIGRFLVLHLLADSANIVYVLVRRTSSERFQILKAACGTASERLIPVWGDLETPGVIAPGARARLAGTIDHVFHLAADYDMNMSAERGQRVNRAGTEHIIELAHGLADETRTRPCFEHMSSVAVAGVNHDGVFSDRMFDCGQSLEHPYFRSKFEAEALVRETCELPWRVYRPGMVLGDSTTGEMDKLDGPYYFFPAIKRVRDHVPGWLPLLGIDGGRMPIAPIDYVVAAICHIAHAPDTDRRAFALIQPDAPTAGQMLSVLLRAAHGPDIVYTLPVGSLALGAVGSVLRRLLRQPAVGRLAGRLAHTVGIPTSVLGYINNRAVFDDPNTRAALAGTGIECPALDDYASVLWQYWEMQLEVESTVSERLHRRVHNKIVVITGASSGIGFMTAKKLARAGATVCMIARTPDKLEATRDVIKRRGGQAHVYPCDLTDHAAIDDCASRIIDEHHHVDILINNAGHSIRRSVFESLDRFHDYQRTMQLNYFGALRLVFNVLPTMAKRRSGHIINISSIGCLTNAPRFSAYVASKSALDAFSRCLSPEVRTRNIDLTTVYMPLVRTPMIAPTRIYDYVPTLTPEQAADKIVYAIIERPKRVASPLGTAAQISYALWPRANDFILHKAFHLFPSSRAAVRPAISERADSQKPTPAGRVLATLLPGPHW